MNFYETKAGYIFFESQLPELITALKDIAAALSRPMTPEKLPLDATNILSDLYWGKYEPAVFHRNEETPKFDAAVMTARTALMDTLPAEAQDRFEAYQEAVDARTSAVLELSYKSGYRTAVQMILAGLAVPDENRDQTSENS